MSNLKAERLSDEAMLILIESVKKREFLWNPADDHYKMKSKVVLAWKEISAEMDMPEDVLRLKWRNVRDIFIREYKRKRKEKNYITQWRFYKIMSFLPLPKIDAGCIVDFEPGTEPFEDDNDSHSAEPIIKFEVQETEPHNETIYLSNDYSNLSTSSHVTTAKRKRTSEEEEEDYDMMYLKSLIPYFRQLDPIRKLVVRSKIQDVLLNEMESQGSVEK